MTDPAHLAALAVVQATIDAVHAPVVVVEADARIALVNMAAQSALGVTSAAVQAVLLQDFVPAGEWAELIRVVKWPGGQARLTWLTSGGGRLLDWQSSLLPLQGGAVVVLTAHPADQNAGEDTRKIKERQMRALVDAVPALLWVVDRDGTCLVAGGRALDLLPPSERPTAGETIFKMGSRYPEFIRSVRRGLTGEAFSEPVELVGRTFESRYEPIFDEDGAMAGLAGVATDISEQRKNEQALIQAQKMESLGTMAGGVAHDFNNLLTAILGFAGIVKLSPGLDDMDREHLYLVEQSARRGADIAGRLLAFSRGGLARIVPVDLREVVGETIRLIQPTIHDRVRVAWEMPAEDVTIEGDFGQIQQALLNIVLNARDVLTEGGAVNIRLGRRDGFACLEVQDDGPGMEPNVRARIFEPFFTTKAPGSGTGLGLSIAYGIVEGHHGQIEVDSAPDNGTTFRMFFPLLVQAPVSPLDLDAGDGDLVLLVDDDDLARRATAAALRSAGYSVIEVSNGPLAVEMVTARPGRFSAMLLDLVMPGMSGREVYRAVAAIRPDLPVIVCTGYAPAAHIDDAMKRSIAGLLQKPFTQERLVGALRAVGAEPGGRTRKAVAAGRG